LNNVFLTWIALDATVHFTSTAKHRCAPKGVSRGADFNPLAPNLGGMQQTQRGFAPLHAPMGGTDESELAGNESTLTDARQEGLAGRICVFAGSSGRGSSPHQLVVIGEAADVSVAVQAQLLHKPRTVGLDGLGAQTKLG